MTIQARMVEVFGFKVPIDAYYLHRGHAWALPENEDHVKVGLDDFSQKILGAADDLKLPEVGKVYYQGHICMALFRQGHKATFEAPVDGVVEAVNPKIRQQPSLIHEDPYGEGWLFLVKPINLRRNLDQLHSGDDNVAWMQQESNRLLNLMGDTAGVTLPDGGTVVDDVYGHYPEVGWKPLVKGFFMRNLMTPTARRGFEGWDKLDQRT